jgi:iron complex outermembrane receptor protein
MELTLSASRLWSHYEKGTFIEKGLNGTYDASGQTVEQAPKYILNIGGTQTVPFQGGAFRVNLNYAYSSSRSLGQDTADPTNPATTPAVLAEYATSNALSTVAGYGLLNGKVEVELNNGLSLTFWGKNLLQKDYYVANFNGYLTLGTAVAFQGTPRTFGVTAGYKF